MRPSPDVIPCFHSSAMLAHFHPSFLTSSAASVSFFSASPERMAGSSSHVSGSLWAREQIAGCDPARVAVRIDADVHRHRRIVRNTSLGKQALDGRGMSRVGFGEHLREHGALLVVVQRDRERHRLIEVDLPLSIGVEHFACEVAESKALRYLVLAHTETCGDVRDARPCSASPANATY